MKEILEMAQSLKDQIVADRRYIHEHPEIGMDLPATCAYIKKRLTKMGIPFKEHIVPMPERAISEFLEAGFPKMERATGVTALIGSGSPCILLRADMDASP